MLTVALITKVFKAYRSYKRILGTTSFSFFLSFFLLPVPSFYSMLRSRVCKHSLAVIQVQYGQCNELVQIGYGMQKKEGVVKQKQVIPKFMMNSDLRLKGFMLSCVV